MRNLVVILSCFLLGTAYLSAKDAASDASLIGEQDPLQVPAAVSDALLSDLYAANVKDWDDQAAEQGETLRLTRISSLDRDGSSFLSFAIESRRTGSASWADKGSFVIPVAAHANVSFAVPHEISPILLRRDFTDLAATIATKMRKKDLHLKIDSFSAFEFSPKIFAFIGLRADPSAEADEPGSSIGAITATITTDQGVDDLSFKSPIGTTGAIGVSN